MAKIDIVRLNYSPASGGPILSELDPRRSSSKIVLVLFLRVCVG